jgi:hypothetical protein
MRLVLNQPNSWVTHPRYRYWMLAFLIAMSAASAYLWATNPGPNRYGARVSVAVSGLLLFNHIVVSFLSAKSQLSLFVPRMLLTAAVGILVVVSFYMDFLK